MKFLIVSALVGILIFIGFLYLFKNLSFDPEPPKISFKPFKSSVGEVFNPESPSLKKIFSQDHQWIATLSAGKIRTLKATGDVILARSVNYKTVQNRNFGWPFEKTDEFLKNADIAFINLESPLVKNCPVTNTGMIFCGDERNIEGLLAAGVDVASLANNHAGNYGFDGIKNTINLLNSSEILTTGVNGPIFKKIRGLRFAFLGYNDIGHEEKGISWAANNKVAEGIKTTRSQADIIIIAFHWGTEYTGQPNTRQKELAHLAINSGADLVIGNHPHWIQPVEIYKGKLITYAHGNFVFDQEWSQKTKEGVVGIYTFYDKQLIDVEFLPVEIADYGQPYFLENEKKNLILKEMKNESLKLSEQ
ncbi:CapA family protein [Candidatus Microgenomates bacterium]|nr:CapA family protein [Candidatus Microgenomates bacterium]